MKGIVRLLPVMSWAPRYVRRDWRDDLAAGLTVGAMLVPQAMAYALLAGLPPETGLYAAIVPVIVYALFGSSRQLAVGPVAIVSLLTASALAPLVEEGTTGYVAAAALLAVMVGLVHLALGLARLGVLVNLLSHSVLVGFTAAAALVIGFSQAKHLFGIQVGRTEHFHETVREVVANLSDSHAATLALGLVSIAVLIGLRKVAPRAPAALIVVIASTAAVTLLNLEEKGVATVGEIPDGLPAFALPAADLSMIGSLLPTALVITLVGFMESIAVAKVYARRNRYDVDANQELIALGAANTAAGLFSGYPVTGGFSRTAVNASAGARTPAASVVTALVVLATLVLLTPLFSSLPTAALAAIIVVAVAGLVDWAEVRHIAAVKRSDLVTLVVAFVATLVAGIELGIAIAVVTSMLMVFVRMSRPHSATLGRVPGTTTYRNVARFPEVETRPGLRIVRVDAALSFANASHVKRLILDQGTADPGQRQPVLVLDASGINDIDVTGTEMLGEVLDDLDDRGVELHVTDLKGPVRDVLHRSGLWTRLEPHLHASVHDAVLAVGGGRLGENVDHRTRGVDERIPAMSTHPSHRYEGELTR
jgi:SulP family sulfate permease